MIKTHFMTLLKELVNFFKKNKSDSSGPGFITPILLGEKNHVLYSVLKIKHSWRKKFQMASVTTQFQKCQIPVVRSQQDQKSPPPYQP